MERKPTVAIVGAGPGGLTAGMLLAHHGFDVTIFEKNDVPGGRNSQLTLEGGYRFDLGPTFLMMKHVLDEVFAETGRSSSDYLSFTKLSPMYRLSFADKQIDIHDDVDRMREEWARVFPDEVDGLARFEEREGRRLKRLLPCLLKDYSSFTRLYDRDFLRAIPHFSVGRSLFDVLGDYFTSADARICFTFQSKYLGMSPWECPGAFGMIPYIEHHYGIYHVEGGLSKISEAMAHVVEEEGGRIRYGRAVDEILFSGKAATGLRFADGGEETFDRIIVNADFGHAMTKLVSDGAVPKYTHTKVKAKKYSCSTFMMYLGLSKQYDLRHHTIVFARDYKKNVEGIFGGTLSFPDFSMYVRDASATDSTLAPSGKTALYILVPVPNRQLGADIDWEAETPRIRARVLELLSERLGMADIAEHIEAEKIVTPLDWEEKYDVLFGATFNLSHNLGQMLWFRPHNRVESVEHLYLVGGGTHPGSGLPTIYESGRISAGLIRKEFGQ
jgi:phytoene desaturase